MSRIQEHREACERDARTRWWRDGAFGLVLGGFGGLLAMVYGIEIAPVILVPSFALAGAALAALFGPRALHWLR